MGVRGRRSAGVGFVAFIATSAGAVAIAPYAAASSPPQLQVSPSGNYQDGEKLTVGVGPNGYFSPHSRVNIIECTDPGGLASNLPKDITTCDGNTIQGTTILVGANGSFSQSDYPVYMLPSSTLGEQNNALPICNQTNYCVLYVGQDQNDFTAPKVFSAPFLISPGPGSTTTTSAGTNAPTGASAAGTTTAVSPSTSVTSTTSTVTSGTLANTGVSAGTAWLAVVGMGLVLTGAMGRRRALRRAP